MNYFEGGSLENNCRNDFNDFNNENSDRVMDSFVLFYQKKGIFFYRCFFTELLTRNQFLSC